MANKIYNVKKAETIKSSIGQSNTGLFLYKGFNSRRQKDKFKEYDVDLVKQDLLNHFNIKRGEKLENPSFGTGIWALLYEPMNDETVNRIKADVEEVVNRDPRVQPLNIQVNVVDQGVRIELDLFYVNTNVREKMAVNFDNSQRPQR
jgi:phage baseplate assembly protein W